MGKKIDLTGRVFGRFTVVREDGNKGKATRWLCRCECGTVKPVPTTGLMRGTSKSCGCLHKEIVGNLFRKHGKAGNKTYKVWWNMLHRCYQKNNQFYAIYGGRGISVCDEWRTSYERFLQDMGDVPKGKFYLDRIDNDSNYCKENCRWVNSIENIRNRSNTFTIQWGGVERRLVDVAEEVGINHGVAYTRVAQRGWSVERALTTAVRNYSKDPVEILKGESYRYRKEDRACKVLDYFEGLVVLVWEKSGQERQCSEKHFRLNFKPIERDAASLGIRLPAPEQ